MVITIYQHNIAWAQPEENRRQVAEAMASVPSETDIFVIPETFTTGFGDHMASLAEAPDGPTLRWAQEMATKHNVLLVGTWIVREGDCCFNRLHWVLPDGTYGFYDKAHTFRPSGEHDIISRGTCRTVFEYKGWRIKPAVCYDLRFPKWLRNDGLAPQSPAPANHVPSPSSRGQVLAPATPYDLLLVCANWPASRREAWTTLLRARAIENLSYVVGCNRTGIDGVGGAYSGDSAIVDYKGFSVPVGTADGSLCLTASLDRQRLDSFRQKWPLYLDFD